MKRKHVFLAITLVSLVVLAVIIVTLVRSKVPNTEFYQDNKVSFSYPTTWQSSLCGSEGSTLQPSGTLKGVNGDENSYPLVLKGFAWAECDNKSLVFSENDETEECASDDYIHQKIKNNLVISYYKYDGIVQKIYIQKKPCAKEPLFVFGFYDSKQDPRSFSIENLTKSAPMGLPYEKLRKSEQLKEVVAFAESIKIK